MNVRGYYLAFTFVLKSFTTLQLYKSGRKLRSPCFRRKMLMFDSVFHRYLCSTILSDEKAQQEERSRMEMRRQVPVSWDSGGSDEAPPKVSNCAGIFLMLNKLIYNVLINV